MELIKDLGVRSKTIQSGAAIGTVKKSRWGLFKCPSCGCGVEHVMYTGANRNSCGAKGCKSATSSKYGHRKIPDGDLVNNRPYYKVFNDFYNRTLKNRDDVDSTWDTLAKFRNCMFTAYSKLRDSGVSSLTLFVHDKNIISSANTSWVSAKSMVVTDFSSDVSAGVFHTKRLAEELSIPHNTVVRSMQKIIEELGSPTYGLTTIPGFINKPSMAYILDEQQYTRLKHKITDARNGKGASNVVYLIKSSGFTKIGITNNIVSRMQSLCGANATSIELVGSFTVTNAREIEVLLHEKYAAFNQHHEWFNLTQSQIDEIVLYLDNL